MKKTALMMAMLFLCFGKLTAENIDRLSLVERNCPQLSAMDTLASLSVGNGNFAFTVDATGLQSFPAYYKRGVCLGTQSQWGWHSFPNTEEYKREEYLRAYDFGHGYKKELYACQIKDNARGKGASDYYRVNPHRLHLGVVGFQFDEKVKASDVKQISQRLDLWRGQINSHFSVAQQNYDVRTVCHPERDMIAATILSKARTPISIRLPYPTGGHVDDACTFDHADKHISSVVEQGNNYAVIEHRLDTTVYYITMKWTKNAHFTQQMNGSKQTPHSYLIVPDADEMAFCCEFTPERPKTVSTNSVEADVQGVIGAAASHWQRFWTQGAAVDFSHCTDPRARELERRVVLSQYLLAIQSAGVYPPQETGLTMNSWFGKFHLEMILWHQAWQPLWGHTDFLARTLPWYATVEPEARAIAQRQGFKGIRWMKMTDPTGGEAPSNVGSFLIWQQPHFIYLSELLYRGLAARSDDGVAVSPWNDGWTTLSRLIDETATWMADFVSYDKRGKRYILNHYIPAQESLKAAETFNSPFELSQWMTTLQMAQQWRERSGQQRNKQWDRIINGLAPLAKGNVSMAEKPAVSAGANFDPWNPEQNEVSQKTAAPMKQTSQSSSAASKTLYLAAESATDTYSNLKMTSDHPAILGAIGFFPMSRLVDKQVMTQTLDWIFDNWNWPTSWGWDFPMAAMCATRMGEPQKAVEALMLPMQKNTYLPNGHNYQDQRLRLYLPGNGGLLSAVALMCAGWDGCTERNPGFPKDGRWDVRWEGLLPMP